jgi:hypothetical protein
MKKPKKIYYIDVPDWTSEDGNWKHIGTTKTKQEAQAILQKRFGINEQNAGTFITEGTE